MLIETFTPYSVGGFAFPRTIGLTQGGARLNILSRTDWILKA